MYFIHKPWLTHLFNRGPWFAHFCYHKGVLENANWIFFNKCKILHLQKITDSWGQKWGCIQVKIKKLLQENVVRGSSTLEKCLKAVSEHKKQTVDYHWLEKQFCECEVASLLLYIFLFLFCELCNRTWYRLTLGEWNEISKTSDTCLSWSKVRH